MTISLSQFHDAELTGINHDRFDSKVLLTFLEQDKGIKEIVFDGIFGFRVTDYGLQNVVSRLLLSSITNFPNEDVIHRITWIKSTSEGKCLVDTATVTKLAEQIRKNDLLMFILEPSWGAEIAILARNFFIR